MGQQQLILIILGTIVVGIAIAISASLFTVNYTLIARDAIVNDLNTISINARAYYVRPRSMGGGNLSYTGYIIPKKFRSNENAIYSSTLQGEDLIFTAISVEDKNNKITAVLKPGGDKLVNWTFYGEFAEYGETVSEDDEEE